jgi:hypothetical protein
MEHKLHTAVKVSEQNLKKFESLTRGIRVIRSSELVAIAYEMGLLNRYIAPGEEREVRDLKRKILEAVLWRVKLDGCSISGKEIEDVLKIEKY